MKKATGDPMVSRRLHFRAHSRFSKKNEFLDKSKNPEVSVFFGFLAISLEQRELLEIRP